jgi:hypothetical protein
MPKLSKPTSGSGSPQLRKDRWTFGYQRRSATRAANTRSKGEPSTVLRRPLRQRKSSDAALRRRPSVCATRSTANSSRREPASSAAARPPKQHHVRFAQPRALNRKVSDEYTVPVCRLYHRELHRYGDEASWWAGVNIDPLPIALDLWHSSQAVKKEVRSPDCSVELPSGD